MCFAFPPQASCLSELRRRPPPDSGLRLHALFHAPQAAQEVVPERRPHSHQQRRNQNAEEPPKLERPSAVAREEPTRGGERSLESRDAPARHAVALCAEHIEKTVGTGGVRV